MLYTGSEHEEVEKYSDYKYRTKEKFKNRFKDIISGIESCSLKKEDKIKLKKELIEILNR